VYGDVLSILQVDFFHFICIPNEDLIKTTVQAVQSFCHRLDNQGEGETLVILCTMQCTVGLTQPPIEW